MNIETNEPNQKELEQILSSNITVAINQSGAYAVTAIDWQKLTNELQQLFVKHHVSSNPVKEIKVIKLLDGMMESDMKLYEQILDTAGFAYYFSELVKLAQK